MVDFYTHFIYHPHMNIIPNWMRSKTCNNKHKWRLRGISIKIVSYDRACSRCGKVDSLEGNADYLPADSIVSIVQESERHLKDTHENSSTNTH